MMVRLCEKKKQAKKKAAPKANPFAKKKESATKKSSY
jgi:hypothetical protein